MCCSQEPLGYFVNELHVDATQHLVPNGSRSLVEPVEGTYYSVAHTGTGFTIVNHIEKKAGAAQAERLLYLETNTNQVLDRTVKDDEILTGAFGTVYVQKTCFFNRPVESNYSSVMVMVGSNNDLGRPEIPLQLSDAPESLPPLTSLSLVRIFQHDSEYAVVSANYESSGELGSLNIGRTKAGEVIPGSASTSFHIDSKNPLLATYGIPLRIDVQEYLRSHRLPIHDVALHQEMVLVNRHYGFDKLIRRDQLKDGARVSSQYLRPSVTEEEKILDSECDSRFRQQQSMGLPTVE
jgi:hypothetical protein